MTTKITVTGGESNAVRVLLTTLNDRGDFQSETEERVEAGESRDFHVHQTLRATIIEVKNTTVAPSELSALELQPRQPEPYLNTNFEGNAGGSAAILERNLEVKVDPLPGSDESVTSKVEKPSRR